MRGSMLDGKGYGLYESREVPKACPKCNSDATKIISFFHTKTGRARKRECVLCGKVFPTHTPASIIPQSANNMMS